MASRSAMLWACACALLLQSHALSAVQAAQEVEVELELGTASAVAWIGQNFVGATMSFMNTVEDNWLNSSILLMNLTDPSFRTLVRGMAPGFFRIGGGAEFRVVMDVHGTECSAAKVDPNVCLTMDRWREILSFFRDTGISMVWSLGAQKRKDGDSPLDFSNIQDFVSYTAQMELEYQKGLYGFELGNELDGGDYTTGAHVSPEVFARDYLKLRKLIDQHWPGREKRVGREARCTEERPGEAANRKGEEDRIGEMQPEFLEAGALSRSEPHMVKLAGPAQHPNANFARRFLGIAGEALDVFTFHNYIGYGLDPKLRAKIMNPAWLQAYLDYPADTIAVARTMAPHAELWVGETSSAWHSGQENTTDRFYSAFWFANSLGLMARAGVSGFARHSFNAGYYAMIDRHTKPMYPHADYWLAYVWKALVGEKVLDIRKLWCVPPAADSESLLVHGFSARRFEGTGKLSDGDGAVILYINLSPKIVFLPQLSAATGLREPRYEYHLRSDALESHNVHLNGALLKFDGQALPDVKGVLVPEGEDRPLKVMPQSIVFIELPNATIY